MDERKARRISGDLRIPGFIPILIGGAALQFELCFLDVSKKNALEVTGTLVIETQMRFLFHDAEGELEIRNKFSV